MSLTPPSPGPPADQSHTTLESLIGRFEGLWFGSRQAHGERPRIDDFLPLAGEQRPDLLRELVHAELELRLKAGEAARVEEYLARYPELTQDPQTVWSLIEKEYEVRARGEPGPFLDELLQRFPDCEAQLRDLPVRKRRPGTRTAEQALTSVDSNHWPVIAGYQILEELGQGTFGVVYKARHLSLDRLVALKMPRTSAGTEARTRFRGEALLVARLNHQGIVQIYEIGEVAGQLYLTMEYLPAGSLATRLDGKAWPVRRAAILVRALAKALQHAHAQGVLHRDLKPANLLLDAEGEPKIADFGLAKLVGTDVHQTTQGLPLGTPLYMSPEQAAGQTRSLEPTTDIYSLGAILYELLTGRPPFHGGNREATLQQVLVTEPIPPRQLHSKIPHDLEIICLKCLRKKPAERYTTAGHLAEDLQRFLDGEPIQPTVPSLWRRTGRWVKRHPAVVMLLLSCLFVVGSAVAGLFWHNKELSRELDEKQRLRDEAERARDVARRSERRAWLSEYAARVRQAQGSFQLGNPFVLRSLLDRFSGLRSVPPAGESPDDGQGFEWHHLLGQRWPEPLAWQAHQVTVSWLAYAPNGNLITAGSDGINTHVRSWAADTGKELWRRPPRLSELAPGHGPPVAFGPRDKGWLAVCDGKAVSFVDLATGRPQDDQTRFHDDRIQGVAVSPNGRWLFAGGNGPIATWDLDKKDRDPSYLFPTDSRDVRWLSLSPDGQTLVTAPRRDVFPCLFWNLLRKGEAAREGEAPAEPDIRLQGALGEGIEGLIHSPNGLLVSVNGEGQVTLRNAAGLAQAPWMDQPAARVNAVAISPDEKLLATGGEDGVVRIWDVPGRSFLTQLRWQSSPVTCLCFSAERLAVGTRDGKVYQLPLAVRTHADRLCPLLRPTGVLAFSPDGHTLALADHDRTVKLLDVKTGKVKPVVLQGQLNRTEVIGFAPDNRTVATIAWGDGRVSLWDAANGQRKHLLKDVASRCLEFAPKGSPLAVGTAKGSIHLFDSTSGAERGILKGTNPEVSLLAFRADGGVLASAGTGQTVDLWNLPDLSGDQLPAKPSASHRLESRASALAFLPDGLLATGEENGWIRIWTETGKEDNPDRSPMQCRGPVRRLEMSGDRTTLVIHGPNQDAQLLDPKTLKVRERVSLEGAGREAQMLLCPGADKQTGRAITFAVVGRDEVVQFWNQRDGGTVKVPAQQPLWSVRSLVFSPDGKTLITSSKPPERLVQRAFLNAPTIRSWDPQSGSEKLSAKFWDLTQSPVAPPERLALSGNGKWLAAGGLDGRVWVWDREGQQFPDQFVGPQAEVVGPWLKGLGRDQRPIPFVFPESLQALAFSPDGQYLATASTRGWVKLWNTTGEWNKGRALPVEKEEPIWVAFSPDGDLVSPFGGQIRFRDPANGALRWALGKEGDSPAVCVAFGGNGNRLAVGHKNGHIRLWDASRREMLEELTGHLDEISGLAFTPDGKTLASSSHDRTVKLWSVEAAAEVASLEAHQGKVHCLAFSPDGTLLATGGEAAEGRGEVYLWRAPRDPGK